MSEPTSRLKELESICSEGSKASIAKKHESILSVINTGDFSSYPAIMNLLHAGTKHKRHEEINRCIEGISGYLIDENCSDKNIGVQAEQLAFQLQDQFSSSFVDTKSLSEAQLTVINQFLESGREMSALLTQLYDEESE